MLFSILQNPLFLCERALDKEILKQIASAQISINDNWLDVGCGIRPYEEFFPEGTYTGVDVESSGRSLDLKTPDIFFDGNRLPFPDASFDGVIATQVMEHVRNPDILLSEISRVLKPGGTFLLTMPFVWEEHEAPYDFSRRTSFGIKALLEDHGLNVNGIIKLNGIFETLGLITNSYIVHNLVPPIRGAGRLIVLLLCFPIQVIAFILQCLLPDKKHFYLNLVVRARKRESPVATVASAAAQ
jgi:SAM-dependent methyltransferase